TPSSAQKTIDVTPAVVATAAPVIVVAETGPMETAGAVAETTTEKSEQAPPFDGPYDNVPDRGGDEDYDEYAPAPAYLEASPEAVSPNPPEDVARKKSDAASAPQTEKVA